MTEPSDDLDVRIEAAVRRYLARVARRYTPVVAGVAAFALIVILVPTVNRNPEPTASSSGASTSGTTPYEGYGQPTASTLDGTSSSASAPSRSAGSTRATPRTSPSVKAVGVESASSPGATVSTQPGVTRSGVPCGPDVPQVSWTVYSPPCLPEFTGDNGGATWHGVTKDSITVTFRRGQSTEDAAVYTAAGDAAPAPDDDFLSDMQTYIDLMNREFELYGRKVVLKDFQGQGDYIREDQGQGQAQAQADAQTAYDDGAFADATFFLKGSRPFWEGLAQHKIVAVGPLGFPDSWYQEHAPYWYSAYPTGSKQASGLVNAVCRRMAGLPAVNAGDAVYQKTPRVFGLVTPENPEYMEIGDAIQHGLDACGVKVKTRQHYAIDVARFQAQATTMVAQMQSSGVTTVLCYCDPLIPIFLSNAADSQQYFPEWFEPNYRDPQGRLMRPDQWAHAISNGGTWPKRAESEAYRAFKRVHPNAEPKEQYYDVAYVTVLYLFVALQAAGPSLTPQNFQRGMWSLPQTATGEYGTWAFGQGSYSPAIDTQYGWWSGDATSNYDGKQGAWQSCEGGHWLRFDVPDDWGDPGTQLRCFGH